LDPSSQHAIHPFQFGLATPIRFGIHGRYRLQDIVNRGTFQCRATGYLEESVLVLELSISLGDVQRNGLRCWAIGLGDAAGRRGATSR
jgi:hypothetical protein